MRRQSRNGRRKMLLAFDALEQWSQARYLARKARTESGWTSVRISKATARALHQLAIDVDAANSDEWLYRRPSLAELLEWLAAGAVIRPDRELARACKSTIVKQRAIASDDKIDGVHAFHPGERSRRTA